MNLNVLILSFVIVALLVAGVYFVLIGSFNLPIHKKALKSATTKKGKVKPFETAFLNMAKKIAPFIKLNVFKKSQLTRALEAIKSPLTAEEYSANVLVTSAVFVLFGLITLPVNVIVSAVIFLYVYQNYKKESRKVFSLYNQKRAEIESELPRFVSFIDQKLQMQDTNVLAIFEEYKLTDNMAFVLELEHTLADMHTSSYENGLLRFNQRIASEQLTMVVRGLLGLVRGEEQGIYFKMLKNDMCKLEINELKRNASKRQKKISRYSGMLFAALMITIVTPLGIVIVDSFSKLFG